MSNENDISVIDKKPKKRGDRILGIPRQSILGTVVILMVAIIILVFFYPYYAVTIFPGEAGVLYKRFGDGTVTDRYYDEGTHLIYPWNKMYKYDVRLQERTSTITALSKDGLEIDITISIRFSPNINTLGILHRYIGPNYIEKVVVPEVEAEARDIIGQYDPEMLYSFKRDSIQLKIGKISVDNVNDQIIVRKALKGYKQQYIIFQDIFIENIELPPGLQAAISSKLVAEQELMEFEYLLQTADKERQRKIIEAEGIARFNEISNISILKWKGLDVTEKFARSKNSKIVVLGTDDKLPIILNGEVNDDDESQNNNNP